MIYLCKRILNATGICIRGFKCAVECKKEAEDWSRVRERHPMDDFLADIERAEAEWHESEAEARRIEEEAERQKREAEERSRSERDRLMLIDFQEAQRVRIAERSQKEREKRSHAPEQAPWAEKARAMHTNYLARVYEERQRHPEREERARRLHREAKKGQYRMPSRSRGRGMER